MQLNSILVAANFVIRLQILIFSVFKIASFFPYCLQIEFSTSLFFYLITFAISFCNGNSLQQMSLQCLSTIDMVFSDEDKKFVFEGLHSKEVDRRISRVGNFLKCNLSSSSAEYLQKICFFINFLR